MRRRRVPVAGRAAGNRARRSPGRAGRNLETGTPRERDEPQTSGGRRARRREGRRGWRGGRPRAFSGSEAGGGFVRIDRTEVRECADDDAERESRKVFSRRVRRGDFRIDPAVQADQPRSGPVAARCRRARARSGGRRADPRPARHGKDHRGGGVRAPGATARAPRPVLRRVQRRRGHARRAAAARRSRRLRRGLDRSRAEVVVAKRRREGRRGPPAARQTRSVRNPGKPPREEKRRPGFRFPDPPRAPRAPSSLRAGRVAGSRGGSIGRQRARARLRARVRGPASAAREAHVEGRPRRTQRRAARTSARSKGNQSATEESRDGCRYRRATRVLHVIRCVDERNTKRNLRRRGHRRGRAGA